MSTGQEESNSRYEQNFWNKNNIILIREASRFIVIELMSNVHCMHSAHHTIPDIGFYVHVYKL